MKDGREKVDIMHKIIKAYTSTLDQLAVESGYCSMESELFPHHQKNSMSLFWRAKNMPMARLAISESIVAEMA